MTAHSSTHTPGEIVVLADTAEPFLIVENNGNNYLGYPLLSEPTFEHLEKVTLESIEHWMSPLEQIVNAADIVSVARRLPPHEFESLLRAQVARKVRQFSAVKFSPKTFEAGTDPVPPSGKVIGTPEMLNLMDASLDGWLTTGRFNQAFETALAAFIGTKHVLTTNSGSSANLLALATLTSPKLGDRALKPGDEIITAAAGFPTTVNPGLLFGLVPVFIDIDLATYNIDASQLAAAITDKTKAIMLAHTLGNTFNVDAVMQVAREHNLWVIEDCCDALGSTYTTGLQSTDYKARQIPVSTTQHVGNFGDIGTLSFYPAHHITMGEGGAVFTANGILKPILESIRDWGRDCFCEPGEDNTCGKRFEWQLGELPPGYDHKYIYSHLGFNLKITDMQAAVGLSLIHI